MKFSLDFKTIVFSCVILILIWWIACNPRARGKVSREAYTAIKDSLQLQQQRAVRAEQAGDSLQYSISQQDSVIADIMDENRLLTAELKIQGRTVEDLSASVKRAKKDKDTITFIEDCTELAIRANTYKNQVGYYVNRVSVLDSMQSAQQVQSAILIAHWRNSFDSCMNVIDFAATELPKLKPRLFKGYLGIQASYTPLTKVMIGPSVSLLISDKTLINVAMETGRTQSYSLGVLKKL